MSIHWMSWAWDHGPADPFDRYIFLKLADNADHDGYCYPSIPEIMEKTRFSESTVRRCLKNLEHSGYIKIERGQGRTHNSKYYLQKATFEKVSIGHNSEPEKVSNRKVSNGKVSNGKVSNGQKKGVYWTEPPHPHKGVTVNEPSNTPIAPKGAQGRPSLPPPKVAAHDHTSDAMEALKSRLGVTNERSLLDFREVLYQHKKRTGMGAYEAANQMAEAWQSYLLHPKRLGKPMSMRMFFTEGHWLRPEGWITLTVEDTKPRRIM